jgi:hypothetical protein
VSLRAMSAVSRLRRATDWRFRGVGESRRLWGRHWELLEELRATEDEAWLRIEVERVG